MRHLTYALAALAWAVTAAPSGALVINNGLAPPNPANILDSTNASATQTVIVTNAGCIGALPPVICNQPGAATTVALVDGGEGLVLAGEGSSRARASCLDSSRLDRMLLIGRYRERSLNSLCPTVSPPELFADWG
jgi:hypothetical protein